MAGHQSRTYVTRPAVSAYNHHPAAASEIIETLTRREQEILQLAAEGLSNREIARQVIISVGTVKVHLSNAYGKLGVTKRTQAVSKARALGILPPQ